MSENPQILSCVLLPVVDRQLLLPNVSVAEIVDYAQPEPVDNGPAWLMGYLVWRGIRLPVISYDAANGGDAVFPETQRGRIAVLNTITDTHQRLPFVAIVTQGIPRLAKVEESLLRQLEADTGPADLMVVDMEGQTLTIPNVEYLEQLAGQAA